MTQNAPLNTRSSCRTLVFYDGRCGLCSREIRHYARLDRARKIEWIDFTQDQTLLNLLGISYDQAMHRLHVLDRNGVLRDGVSAFLAIWSELPGYQALARLIYLTHTVPMLEVAYRPFSKWRYKRRMRSQACAVTASNQIARTP